MPTFDRPFQPPPVNPPAGRPIRLWLALTLTVVALFLAVWIVLPPYHALLLPLSVGAPELSIWFVLVGLLALALVVPNLRRVRLAQLIASLAVVAVGIASVPLARFLSVAESADQSMRLALGGKYEEVIPATTRARFRSAPLVMIDLLLGYRASYPDVQIMHDVVFRVVDEDTLTLEIYTPPDTGLRPILVQVYGGAWQRGSPSDFAEFATYFANQGYVVVAVDYRHAPAFTFPAPVEDVRFALEWIATNAAQLRADTSRMALVGRSAGAHLAMMVAYAIDAPRIRGVVDFYGPVDLVEGYAHPPDPDPLDVRAIEEAFLGGTPTAIPDRYRNASPLSLVTRVLPPTLLLYGQRDHIVESRFGALLAGRLHAEGTVAVHVEIPWAEHAFDAVPHGPSGQLSRFLIERFLASVMLESPLAPGPPIVTPDT